MPPKIEKVLNETRIDTLKELAQSNIKSVLYWRPLIEGVNTSIQQLKKVLDVGEKYSDAFVISGLRYSGSISSNIEKCGYFLPKVDWEPGLHKTITKKTKELILKLYEEKGCLKQLFYKSSCVISYFEEKPDYNSFSAGGNHMSRGKHFLCYRKKQSDNQPGGNGLNCIRVPDPPPKGE